jgi:hypothetical protein
MRPVLIITAAALTGLTFMTRSRLLDLAFERSHNASLYLLVQSTRTRQKRSKPRFGLTKKVGEDLSGLLIFGTIAPSATDVLFALGHGPVRAMRIRPVAVAGQ